MTRRSRFRFALRWPRSRLLLAATLCGLSMFLSTWLGLKVSTRRALIGIGSPVCGFRPMRALLLAHDEVAEAGNLYLIAVRQDVLHLHDAPAAGDDARGARWRLFESVDATLRPARRRCSRSTTCTGPTSGTLLLLAHLVRAARPAALLVVGTYRESELSRTHPLAGALGDLRRERLYERVSLAGSTGDVAELVRGWLGSDARGRRCTTRPAATRSSSRRSSATCARRATARGDPGERQRGARAPPVAPRAKREPGARRPPPSPGASSSSRCSSASSARGHRRARGGRGGGRRAARPRGRRRPGRYGFAHPLVRETVYEELSLTRRVRLHGAVADALEALHGDDPRPPHRAREPPPRRGRGGDRPAPSTSRCAPRATAWPQLAYEEAAATGGARALEALDDGAGRCTPSCCSSLGEALLRSGDEAAAREAFAARRRRSRATPGDAERARPRGARRERARRDDHRRRPGRRSALLREALGALPDDGRAARAAPRPARDRDLLRLDAAAAQGDRRRGGRASRGARATRPRCVAALNARRVALWSAAYLDERLDTAAEMVAAAERAGDVEGVPAGAQLARRRPARGGRGRRRARGGRAPRGAGRPPAPAGVPVVGADVALDARDRGGPRRRGRAPDRRVRRDRRARPPTATPLLYAEVQRVRRSR